MSCSSKTFLLLTFSAVALILVAESHSKLPLKEEKKNLLTLLNQINKPAIKSFQTEHGDIFDCIDINKQLAFDHPLLKNHTVQLRPTWNLNNNNNPKNGGSSSFRQDGISCPFGTVVVKRTTEEDLIQAQRLKSMGFNHARYGSSKSKNADLTGFHFAVAEYRYFNFGAKVNLSIWEPQVSPTQFSSASLLMAEGLREQFQGIRAGWIVYQWLNKNHTRLYTYWTADGFRKTGCYNMLCPGFVQVSTRISLGALLQPVSTYGGQQYDVWISIYKDKKAGHWWLVVYDENVGYWPNSLFTEGGLAHGADLLSYGGEVYSPVKEKSPSMGSGHFPREGYKKAAYVNGLRVVNNNGDPVFWKPLFPVKLFLSNPNCYKAEKKRGHHSEVWNEGIFYGGPGGCV